MSPTVPRYASRHFAPGDCALSSMIAIPCSLASGRSVAKSAPCPKRLTTIMAFVRGVMRDATDRGSMQNVRSSMSANIGVAPFCMTQVTDADIEYGGTMTSSPGPMPSATIAPWSAVVAELNETACFTLNCFL